MRIYFDHGAALLNFWQGLPWILQRLPVVYEPNPPSVEVQRYIDSNSNVIEICDGTTTAMRLHHFTGSFMN